jgi:hypothetical protein
MLEHLTDRASRDAIPIEPIAEGGLERWLAPPAGPCAAGSPTASWPSRASIS